MTRPFRRHGAFTLAEVLIASVVLAIAAAALTQAIVAGQVQTSEALRDWRAVSLAEALLEEVLALPYDDPQGASAPGPEAGENSRASFDNCDDFHGFTETAGNLTDATGAAYGQTFQIFSRSVTAAYTTQTPPGLGGPINGLDVTVTVTDDRQTTWSISRFIAEPVQ